MKKEFNLSERIYAEREPVKYIIEGKEILLFKFDDVKEFIRLLKEELNIRRKKINEEISDERLTAHLHTFVNHFENCFDKLAGEKLK